MEVAATSSIGKKNVTESRLILVDFIAQAVLAAAVGIATSLALACAVLLLAGEAQTQHDAPAAVSSPATGSIDADNRSRESP